jgi:hypothetical protein
MERAVLITNILGAICFGVSARLRQGSGTQSRHGDDTHTDIPSCTGSLISGALQSQLQRLPLLIIRAQLLKFLEHTRDRLLHLAIRCLLDLAFFGADESHRQFPERESTLRLLLESLAGALPISNVSVSAQR